MSADTADDADRLESRVAALEATNDQLNERMGALEDEMRQLRTEMQDLRSDMNDLRDSVRNWAVFTVLFLTAVLTLFQFLV